MPKATKPRPDADDATSRPAEVDAWFKASKHPLHPVLQAIRKVILGVDPSIGEQVKWGHPTFFFTGPMRPFPPKTYKRVLVVTNLHSKDGGVLLVFWQGGRVKDDSGLLSGDYADGRRLARFHTVAEVKAARAKLDAVVKRMIALVDS